MTTAREAFKKIKKESVSSWKIKCDKVFSIYIRQKYADELGNVSCYTCGKQGNYKTMQNGHFVSRNNSATRFSESNCRVQCAGCNIWGRGRYDVYADKLIDELGNKKFKELVALGRSIHKFSVLELKDIHDKYSNLIK